MPAGFKQGIVPGLEPYLVDERSPMLIDERTPMLPVPAPPPPPPPELVIPEGLTVEDLHKVAEALDNAQAPATRQAYRSGRRRFRAWCENRKASALPADPMVIAVFLSEIAETLKMNTVRLNRTAIADAHLNAGYPDPTAAASVKKVLKGLSRMYRKPQGQAKGLTAEVLAGVRATACIPRHLEGVSQRMEAKETALARGLLDIAICGVIRDGMLRRSEAEELRWNDLEILKDGTGRITIRFSKTDQTGEGATLYLSAETVQDLELIRPDVFDPEDRIFGLSSASISRRVRKACTVAGFGDGFSGHSGRVGMAEDLADAGAGLPALMKAGRWDSPAMPMKYIRNATAGRGAVAKFHHGEQSPDAADP